MMPKMRRSQILRFLALTLLAACACAQEPAERRTLLVSVLDKQGQPVSGLLAEQFKVTLRKQPVITVSAREVVILGRIVILMDTSGSMSARGSQKLRDVFAAIQTIAHLLGENHEIAFLTFDDKVQKHFGFQKGSANVLAALRAAQIHSKGKTALFDGIAEAIQILEPVKLGDVVLIFSDGGDNASRTAEKDLRQTIQQTGVRIFAAALPGPMGSIEGLNGPGELKEITLDSGGQLVKLKERYMQLENVQQALTPLLTAMVYDYRLEIELPTRQEKAGELKLSVVDSQQKRLKDVTVVFPHRLQPLAPSPK